MIPALKATVGVACVLTIIVMPEFYQVSKSLIGAAIIGALWFAFYHYFNLDQ